MSHQHEGEPNSNFMLVCSSCAPKPGKFIGQDPKSFVGNLVKIGFKGINPSTNKENTEHMWVKVQAVAVNDMLRGILDNEPYFTMNFALGDEVAFRVSEIEDMIVAEPTPAAS